MSEAYGRVLEIETDGAIFRYPERSIHLDLVRDVYIEPDTGEIVLYNLSPDTIDSLREGAPIQIRAGYGSDIGVLFNGSIEAIYTDHGFMEDIETRLLVVDGSIRSLRLDINIPSHGWRSVKQIIYDTLSRASLPVIFTEDVPDRVYYSYTISGTVQEELTPILKDLGVVGHIVDSRFVIHPINTPVFDLLKIAPENGLLARPHPIKSAEPGETGYEIMTFLYHQLRPAGIIEMDSRFLRGKFVIRKIRYKVTDSEFVCNMEVYQYGRSGTVSK